MKKILTFALSGIVFLAGCKQNGTAVRIDGNAVIMDSAELRLDIPEDWSVTAGKEVYDEIFPRYSDIFDSAEDMRKALEEAGEEYIVYAVAADSSAIFLVTGQDMSTESGERTALEELARTLHNDTLFDYQASGYRTGSNSVFEPAEIAGQEGWLSFFEIYLPQEDGLPTFELAQELFMFEQGNDVYSVQLIYSDDGTGLKIGEMLSKSDGE